MTKYQNEEYLDALIQLQPRWLSGHPALLSHVANNMQRYQRRFQTKLAFVESNADYLGPEMRNRLAEVFECPIANHYGCKELLTIAYECPQGKMHLFDQCVAVELLPLPGDQLCEIVASSLILESMPFLRYRVGDSIQPEKQSCSCGNTAPLLGQVQGRMTEFIAGTLLLGHYFFSHCIHWILRAKELSSLLRYQIHQTAMNEFLVLFQFEDQASSQRFEHFEVISTMFSRAMERKMPQWTFTFECVDHIALTPGGKMQYFICHV
jgi:phenylacetate-CoA ligase